jgi:hypothetical protein
MVSGLWSQVPDRGQDEMRRRASDLDHDILALDPAGVGFHRLVGRRRNGRPGFHVEQRLVDRTLDAIAVEIAFR